MSALTSFKRSSTLARSAYSAVRTYATAEPVCYQLPPAISSCLSPNL